MPFGSKRFFSKFSYDTAAAQHATIDISGCELSSDAAKFGTYGLKTLQQTSGSNKRDIGNAQITIYPKDTSFYLNKNYAWTVECWVRAKFLQGVENYFPSGVYNLGPYTEGPNWRILIVHPSRLADDTRNQFVMNRNFYLNDPVQVPYAAIGSDGTGNFRTVYENSSLGNTYSITNGQSYHIAAVSTGTGILKWFVDGYEGKFSGYNQTYTYTGLNRNVSLGLYEETYGASPSGFSLYFDDVRISNIARYSSNFTPPTNPFTPDKNVLAIFRFENNTNDSSF